MTIEPYPGRDALHAAVARQAAEREAEREANRRATFDRAAADLAAHLRANPPTPTGTPPAADREDTPPMPTTDEQTARALQKMRTEVGLPPAAPEQTQASTSATTPTTEDAATSAALARMANATGVRLTTNQK